MYPKFAKLARREPAGVPPTRREGVFPKHLEDLMIGKWGNHGKNEKETRGCSNRQTE